MSHKPTPSEAVFSALPGHRVLALEGPDAAKFAQAQFMGDVAQLADGHWQWNGWLTPKGRVIALFALLRFDASRIWLLLPDADVEALALALRGFLFRSKLRIDTRPDLHVRGALHEAGLASGAHFAITVQGDVELDMRGSGGGRCLRIGTEEGAAGDSAFSDAWSAADLRHGLPRLPPGDTPQWTPQQLSLDRLDAYSVRKGCYPGQEIVARTHFLGRAKRGLVLLAVDDPTQLDLAGAEVIGDGAAAGAVASAVAADGHMLVLAVMALDHAGPLAIGGRPAQRQAIAAGLARGAVRDQLET